MAQPWAPLTAALVGMALMLPALGLGLLADDYFHRAILLGAGRLGRGARPAFDLYSLLPLTGQRNTAAEIGLLGWWADPHLRLALFRPLSALTQMLDYALWPNQFALQHLHSLLWYGLSVFAVAKCYRRVHGPTAVAGLAAIFFAIDDAHAVCAGWLANRNALVSLACGMFALNAHCRWRTGAARAWGAVAAALFAAALLSSEAGLAVAAYIVAWQLAMDEGRWRDRGAALWPYAVIVVAWRLLYSSLGYGTNGSGLYIDPGRQPLAFAWALAERWPVLQLGLWTPVPSDAFVLVPPAGRLAYGALGLVVCLALLRLFWPLLAARREARFWALGMGLALVPSCGTFPMDRLVLVAGVGAFGLLALFVEYVGLLPGTAPGVETGRTWGRVLVVVHGPLAALMLIARLLTLPALNQPLTTLITEAPATAAAPRQTFVFVTGLPELVAYVPIIRDIEAPALAPRRVALLASALNDNVVYREAVDTLVITTPGGLLRHPLEQLMRTDAVPFAVGETIERPDFTAEVRALTPDGRPAQVAFRFRAPLDSPEYHWLTYSAKDVSEFHLPPVSGRIDIPHME
jgi:hypothetical protein